MENYSLIETLKSNRVFQNVGITFVESGDKTYFLSYRELYDLALKVLAFFQDKGLKPKDELVFQVEDNRTFIIAFWACILGGIIPVPLSIGIKDDHKKKFFNVWQVLNHPYLLTTNKQSKRLQSFLETNELEVQWQKIETQFINLENLLDSSKEGIIYSAQGDDIAFIQFSSGSTGSPKGVVLTHKNLITNVKAIANAAQYTPEDSTLSWMPLTHDMGMIGFHLNPLFSKMNQYLIPTALFVRRPALWLDKATEYQISILCSPNFGYKYILKHCPDTEKYDWNLTSVRLVYNGAEPISERLCYDFLDRMKSYGLKKSAMCPVYGLAEASLAVSISSMEAEVISCQVDRTQVNFGDKVVFLNNDENAISFVNVGKAIDDCAIRVTDEKHQVLAEGIIGHLQIKGDNVTSGYYNNPEATQKVISPDNWLDTGDLAFVKEGNLYITGRAKDIIFINGQNYYPHDIEEIASSVAGVELNKIVVTGYFNSQSQRDESIAFVYYKGSTDQFITVAQSLKAVINAQAGFELDRILPVKDIPRTTSGKLQRFKLLEQYQNGDFEDVEGEMNLRSNQASLNNATVIFPPENDLEKRVLLIWQKVLPAPDFGVNHRFFEIGGNSLKAAEIGMLIWQEFQVELPFELLYEKQTVRELATEIVNLKVKKYFPIAVVEKQDFYELSSAQRRFYYLWESNKQGIAYNTPAAFELKGELDVAKLEASIKKIVARHDTLRISFALEPQVQFKVDPAIDFSLQVLETTLSELDEKLQNLVQPFDLEVSPLFRVALLSLNKFRHVFFLDFHHIISDGLSVHHFLDEVMQLYAGHELPEVSLQFKDFVGWEKNRLSSEESTKSEDYWCSQMAGELPVLELPLDFSRPAIFNPKGQKLAFELEEQTSLKLKAIAQKQKCSLHVLLLSIYRILLAKYAGQEDLIIGIPVAGRTHPELQNMQGLFVNSLAIRNKLYGQESFIELLGREQDNMTQALHHQEYPFDYLFEKLGRKRDVSRNPLFDTMFVFQNMGLPLFPNDTLDLSRHFFNPGFSKFDLSMEVFAEDSIYYSLEYATELFKEETVRRMAGYFENLIAKIIHNPSVRIADLELLNETERACYIYDCNDTSVVFPQEKTVQQLFEEQADKQPEAIAIEHQGVQMSYQQLNQKATYLAILLKEKGLMHNGIVAVLLPRSPDFIIALLAIWKAGGSYLPLDIDLPEERIKYIITDSKSQVVLSSSACEQLLKNLEATSSLSGINIDNVEWENHSLGSLKSSLPPAELAYLIYTSGTTGRPKGVMIRQSSLVNYICWAAENYIQGETVSFPLFTSVSFDLTVTSIFAPLITGNKIVIYGDEETSLLIEKVMVENKVEIIKLTPAHLRILKNSSIFKDKLNSKIRRFIIGGELLESQLAKEIYDLFDQKVELYNEYGPTEATVGCMIYLFDPQDSSLSVPIGVPAANTQIYVLDKFLNPVPEGVKGELYLSGAGLAEGYYANETLTSEKFVAHPFIPQQKMYKTGDIVRWLPGGNVEYLERADQQVKINGYRIELAEIEQQLLSHDLVSEALIRLRTNAKGQPLLYAYYRSKEEAGKRVDAASLRNYLATRLPHYMMPVHFIVLDNIPLTLNGKIDDLALPLEVQPEIKLLPENYFEKVAVKVWNEVMGGEILVTDNFFELGGDSIKAVQIVSRLKGQGISLEVKDILTYQTIKEIGLRAKINHVQDDYEQGVIAGTKELSPIESWFFSHNFKNPSYYNQTVLLKLNRAIDVALLKKAFEKLVEHHDGLRLNYDSKKGKLYYNNRYLTEGFKLEEFTLPPGRFNIENSNDFSFFASLKDKFEISGSLLLGAGILRIDDDISHLCITAHHLLIDGVSWRIFLEDLYAYYHILERKESLSLPSKTASLTDWQAALLKFSNSENLLAGRTYWESIASNDFCIPLDFETEDWRTQNLNMVSGTLDKAQTEFLLKEAHQAYKTDVPILLNTALALALKDWTGAKQLLVEQENHGRHLEGIDVSRTMGWFTALYPVEITLIETTIGDQIKTVKEQLRMVPDKGLGYGIYQYLTDRPVGKKRALAEIRFNYLGQFGEELGNDLFTYSNIYTGHDSSLKNKMTAKVECNLLIVNGLLNFEIAYNELAHARITIESFAQKFLSYLQVILNHLKSEENIYFSPSDFDAVKIDQEEIDALFE